jgi:hypothetical protein
VQVLRKADIIRKNTVESVQAERNILITVRNPFVVCIHSKELNKLCSLDLFPDCIEGCVLTVSHAGVWGCYWVMLPGSILLLIYLQR